MDITPRDPAGHFGQNPESNGTQSPNLSRVFAVGEAQVQVKKPTQSSPQFDSKVRARERDLPVEAGLRHFYSG